MIHETNRACRVDRHSDRRATCLSLAAEPLPKADLVVVCRGISGLAATSLLIENSQVWGVRGVGLRDGSTNDFRATSVVLSTGGFESNLELVR